jgi:phosphatidylethanolamine-binding protein (PEBP) family uncharacterized protein
VPRRSALAVVVALAALATACNDDGRTLAPAPSTTTSTTVESTPEAIDRQAMSLTSPDLVDGEPLDQRFTCDGGGDALTLFFRNVPDAAAELAVAFVDLDAGTDGFVRWLVTGLPPSTGQVVADALPDGAVTVRGSSGIEGWDPPCPGSGDDAARFEARLYAVPEPVGLSTDIDAASALRLLDQAAVEQASISLVGTVGGR